jgi:6-phosphofructokinase 1
MGRNCGWIALHAGVAGGADVILIPEIPYDIKAVARKIEQRRKYDANFSIIVIAEGAHPKGGDISYLEYTVDGKKRLGGAGELLKEQLKKYIDMEIRLTVLGHLQRGGSPVSFDRVLATRFGSAAIDLIAEGKFGQLVCLKGTKIVSVPLSEAIKGQKTVPLDYDLLNAARDIGLSLGD